MEPENTPLEEENRLNQTKPLFSGSMLIFGGVKKEENTHHKRQVIVAMICSQKGSHIYIYTHNVAITCFIDEISLK